MKKQYTRPTKKYKQLLISSGLGLLGILFLSSLILFRFSVVAKAKISSEEFDNSLTHSNSSQNIKPQLPYISKEPTNLADSENLKQLKLPVDQATRLYLSSIIQSADFYHRGLLIDVGSDNFILKAANRNAWGKSITLPSGSTIQKLKHKKASINIFLPKADDYYLELSIKPGEINQTIELSIDDYEAVSLKLDSEYLTTYRVKLTGSEKFGGYHTLRLRANKTPLPEVDYFRFRPVTSSIPAPDISIPPSDLYQMPDFTASSDASSDDLSDDFSANKNDSLVLPGEGGIVFHLQIPETTELKYSIAFERNEASLSPLTFLIRIIADNNEEGKLLAVKSFNNTTDRSKHIQAVDLSAYSGKIVRLEFWTVGGNDNDKLLIFNPQLQNYMPPASSHKWIPPKNVIVYLSDTLRWDKIKFYKPKNNPIITPNFNKIAREGIAFTNAISQGNWSKPSQAGIMGGRYPFDMKMVEAREQRTGDTELIASTIKRARPEIVTGSYSSNGYVSNKFGFSQKWDHSRNMIREQLPNRTEYLYKAMFPDWEKYGHIDKSFFVWFGTIDPHVAYNPRKKYLDLYDPEPYYGFIKPYKTAYILLDIMRKKVKYTDRDWHHLLSLYHGEITYNDHQLGVLMNKLDDWGILEDTAIILISDHGEEFLEHGGMGHGRSLYDEQVRVPLIIYYPKGFPRPRVIDTSVETMAIYTTILDMFEIKHPKTTQAESLIKFGFGVNPLVPRLSVVNNRKVSTLATVSSWRLMMKRKTKKLFNIKNDPYQKKDLFKTRPDVVYYLTARYNGWKELYR